MFVFSDGRCNKPVDADTISYFLSSLTTLAPTGTMWREQTEPVCFTTQPHMDHPAASRK